MTESSSTALFNSEAYFREEFIDAHGFREYDARWVIEPLGEDSHEIGLNYRGLIKLGRCLGGFLRRSENGGHKGIAVGHDFRRYSENVKNALVVGLLWSGLDVVDFGLCLTPMLYFAQYDRKLRSCAMVTASHNPNGWTGIKMGLDYSVTFGTAEMKRFKNFVQCEGLDRTQGVQRGGTYEQDKGLVHRYCEDLLASWRPRFNGKPVLRVALETGNGGAGSVLPKLLTEVGIDVVPGKINLDWRFPNFNPNPESVPFLQSVQNLVTEGSCDVGVCIDGDGDRLGVVDNRANIVFSDRAGLVIARKLASRKELTKVVVDVKCTSLFDSELKGMEIIWEKTGHSFIKSAVKREKAEAGFERSGHFFFGRPYGRGYDDACLSVLMLLWVVADARQEGKSLADLVEEFPASHQSPNRQPHVSDSSKYQVIEDVRRRIEEEVAETGRFAGGRVKRILTINGVRVEFEGGSWLLIRASSNTPNLVILAETFEKSEVSLDDLDQAVRQLLDRFDHVGEFEPLQTT